MNGKFGAPDGLRPSDAPSRAVILAGGLGMRLRPYTLVLPKPLIPLADQPILEHIIRRLVTAGVRRIDLCLGSLGGLIQTYFSQATTLPPDLELVYHWEEEPQGTAGALRAIRDVDGPMIVMNGDIFTTLDYRELLGAHVASGAALTIAMHRETVDISLGVIQCVNGQVVDYREKPKLTYEVSMGIYVYERRALDALLRREPDFPRWQLVFPFHSDAVWYDIGTIGEYERATADLSARPELFVA